MSWGIVTTLAGLAIVLAVMAVFFLGFLAVFAAAAGVGATVTALSRTTTSRRKLGQTG